ncbi:hypothetical protein ABPG72_011141 [Tetrahymena utriculariae]
MILAPQRWKKINGLILAKEITSQSQIMKSLTSNSVHSLDSLQYSFLFKQVSVKGQSDIIDALINKWEKKPEDLQNKDDKKDIKEKYYDINLLITCCLVQLQNEMNEKQKKKAFSLVITQINSQEYLEDEKDLLYQFLSFLKASDKNFLNKREKIILRKLKILLDMYENKIITNLEQLDTYQLSISQINQKYSLQISIIILKQVLDQHLKQNCGFIPELVELIFSISENLNIFEETEENLNFCYYFKIFNQNQKKTLLNDQVFIKMLTNIKEAGQGVQNKNDPNKIGYSDEQIRKIQGTYTLLFVYIENNQDYFSLIARKIFNYIQFHLKNPQIVCFAVKALHGIAQYAFNSIICLNQFYMDYLLDIFQNETGISNSKVILIIEHFIQLIMFVDNQQNFYFYEYIPRLFEICMKQYSSSSFRSQPYQYQSLIQDLIVNILSKEKVEYYIQNLLQPSVDVFFSNISQSQAELDKYQSQSNIEDEEQIKSICNQINHIKCLCSLANMYTQTQNLKNDDLVSKVKKLLMLFANQVSEGKFDNSIVCRLNLYLLFQSLNIKQLDDQDFVDEIFLKLYATILADCQHQTNFQVQYKNLDEIQKQEDEENQSEGDDNLNEESDEEEVFLIQPDVHLANLKQCALQQLGQFIEQCPKIVMEHKKFEIVQVLHQISINNLENHFISLENFIELGQVLKCIQINFQKYYPNLYLNNHNNKSCSNKFLSNESKLEYTPIFQIILKDYTNINRQNLRDTFVFTAQQFYSIVQKLDIETRRTYFNQIYQAIKFHIKQTLDILSPHLIQWHICTIRFLYKAYPTQIKITFLKIWQLISYKAFNQQAKSKYYQDDGDDDYDEWQSNFQIDEKHEYQDEQSPKHQQLIIHEQDQHYQIDQQEDENNSNEVEGEENVGKEEKEEEYIDQEQDQINEEQQQIIEEEKEEEINTNKDEEYYKDYEEEQIDDNHYEKTNNNEDEKTCNQKESQGKNLDKSDREQDLNLIGLDTTVVSDTIRCISYLIKYDKYVYQVVSSKINRIILNKIFFEDSIIQRNCLYYLNKVTRFCFDSVEKDTFKQLFKVVKQLLESKELKDESNRDIVENIYITFCLMAIKLLENKQSEELCDENMMIPFNNIFQAIPFQENQQEMKRFIQICEYLLEFNAKIILQNLQKLSQCIIFMINQPMRYKIFQKDEHQYKEFFDKLVQKFPQVKSIAQRIINLNLENVFFEKEQLLKKLDII